MLLENPRRRGRGRRRYNPYGFDAFGNMNPRRRRRKSRRNPMAKALELPRTVREWTQGVDVMDAGAAVGGLAAATMIPGIIVKDPVTIWQKLWKLGVSLGAAFGAGAIGRAVISPSAGKAAVIGGVAGTAATAIGMFTGFTIGQPKKLGTRRIGETTLVSPSPTREGETVNVILP